MGDPQILLEVKQVVKRYDERRVLRGASLQVKAGEALFLLGSNGAGKSTLLRVIAGRFQPESGSVTIAGKTVKRNAANPALAMIGHEPGLHPALSVEENLVWYAQALGVQDAKARAGALIQEFGLERVAKNEAAALSRGQAQRVGLARALLAQPKLLLLDEPFTGLDERARAMLLAHLRHYLSEGGAILLTSHDLLLASELATRTLWLHKGVVDSDGDVLARYREAMAPKSKSEA
ncbi:MAG: heme ABC exporter ATP-binding protein CcmA [Planctomycetes bacterium]|nr:heme ABC exporter ATP-binding protein CcmA [Planctomycetota bacterium]